MAAAHAADLLICGLPRSGTSLTRGLFAAHPAYAVPRDEMGWWVSLYARFRGRPARWDAFLAALAADEKTATLGLDPVLVQARLAAVPRGAHHAAFAEMLALFAERAGRPRWGEKTLFAELHAGDALRALPNLKVIHLLRDPRDVYASTLHAPWRTVAPTWWGRSKDRVRGHLAWTLRNWRTSVRLARRQALAWPDRYRAVRYEDLVRNPTHVLGELCAFVRVAFHPCMLALDAYPDVVQRNGNSSFGPIEGISTAPIGRFADVLLTREIALCDALAGGDLASCGYSPVGVRLGTRARLRQAVVARPVAAAIGLAHEAALRVKGVLL